MEAKIHPRQTERLEALRSYEILDTDREADFDEVVKLAAQLCGAPISVINLIDADRQWFKAEVGLGTRQTPLATSLCSHAILEQDFLEVPDTLEDSRMSDNPLCAGDSGVRFYAGALLRSDEGLPLGTLCVLDNVPRQLTPLQRDTLRVMARQVMNQLDLRRSLASADVLRREVDHRVKNSLQSVSSLIRIQAREAKDVSVREALMLVDQRIGSVSALHEQLYKTDAGARIDLSRYVSNLAGFLQSSAPDGVKLVVEADPVVVSSERAGSIGILVNEFVTNAFKHAFPDGRSGTLLCRVERLEDGLIRMSCSDDGIGRSQRAKVGDAGLGMRIAEAVSQQVGGTLEITPSRQGMTASVTFPED